LLWVGAMLRFVVLALLIPAAACSHHLQVAQHVDQKIEAVSMTIEAAPELAISPDVVAVIRQTYSQGLEDAGIKLDRASGVRLIGKITHIDNGHDVAAFYNGDAAGAEFVAISWTIEGGTIGQIGQLRTETSALPVVFGNSLHTENRAAATELAAYLAQR